MTADPRLESGPAPRTTRWPLPSTLALGAAVLAAPPLVVARLGGAGDLDPFFVALMTAAVLVAVLLAQPAEHRVPRLVARAIVVAWLAVAALIAVLLGMYQVTCACSSPDPASLPPPPTLAGLPATAFHVLATYGGGLLVTIAAFGIRVRVGDGRRA